MANKFVYAWAFVLGLAKAGFAETPPLSAIDWLSNSVNEEPSALQNESVPPKASAPQPVRVLPLDAPVIDTAGLIAAEELGVPFDLWGRSSASDLSYALSRVRLDASSPPSLRRFMVDLLKTRLAPPIDAVVDDSLFYGRVDALLEKGHLDAADALMAEAGQEDPQVFRRRFDIALLTGTETQSCGEIIGNPELSPTYPARIFCLARLGQFDVAALTLGNAETLGILSQEEDALLLLFLDPELFENEPLPAPPKVPTPLQFRLYEAVGERIATSGLPVPFAHADLSNDVGWKARLSAAERLAAMDAIPFGRLLAVYRERSASASGGVWTRVTALQSLADAVETDDPHAIFEALPKAWAAAGQSGYGAAFANWLLPKIQDVRKPHRATHLAFEVALISGDPVAARAFANQSSEDRFVLSLAVGQAGSVPANDALGRAVLRGLSSLKAGASFEALIADDRRGEVLFRVLEQLSDGATGNPDITANALAALRRLGLHGLARQVAVELILQEGAA